MRIIAFASMLIAAGLMWIAVSNGGPQCKPVSNCSDVLILMATGMALFYISAIICIELTLVAWIVRFISRHWQAGQQHD